MKKISVIIPVYNTEQFIEDCLHSVRKQTYENLEIIIIDDCSDDNSSYLIKKLQNKDNRIRFFNLKQNLGAGAARNFGINQATGDYIYFLDSDDYIPENTIKFLVENIGDHDVIRGRLRNTHFSNSFTITFEGTFQPKLFTNDRFNLLKHNSVVNFLISREYIVQNNFKFSEDLYIYSDLTFIIPILSKVDVIPYINEAIYFKRHRPDPILNPSLKQQPDYVHIKDFLNMYIELKRVTKNKAVRHFLDTYFLNFYRSIIVDYFKTIQFIEHYYDKLFQATKLLDLKVIKQYDWILKREFKRILNGNLKSYKKMMRRHRFYRSLKKGITSRRNFYTFLYEELFIKLPVKSNLIFFESFGGKSYSDNPKYIYEHTINYQDQLNAVWSFEEKQTIPGNGKQVKRLSLKYYYYLARSKYWVINARMPNNLVKREETIYLQTWHGTPLKKLAGDLDNVYMPGTNTSKYKTNFYNETKIWDYLISPNTYSSNIFKRAFWFDKSLLEFGYPRNDILYNKNNETDIDRIKSKLDIPKNKKVILYAPTWRDDEYYSVGKYQFSLKLDLEKMQTELGNEYIIILRMHYLIASNLDISNYRSFVYDFSSYNDISELYLVSDILITDYSSVFFDYANLKRPILFYTYDLDKYRDQLRGFYLDIEEDLPGPLLKNTNEIVNHIKNINVVEQDYKVKYKRFYEKFCEWDNGSAAENVLNEILKLDHK